MADELDAKPQVGEAVIAVADGEAPEGEPQPKTDETAEAQPGAEEQETSSKTSEPVAPAPARVPKYTEDQVRQIRAESDKATAKAQQELAHYRLQERIKQTAAWEAQQSAADKAQVDQGAMDADVAKQREQSRREYLAMDQRIQQAQQVEEAMDQRLVTKGKVVMAMDLAERYGLKAEDLVADKSVVDEASMYAAALKLVHLKGRKATAKREIYDKGPTRGGGTRTEAQALREMYNKSPDLV